MRRFVLILLFAPTLALANTSLCQIALQASDALVTDGDSPVQAGGIAVSDELAKAFQALPSQRGSNLSLTEARQHVGELILLAKARCEADNAPSDVPLILAMLNQMASEQLQRKLAQVDLSEEALRARYERNLEGHRRDEFDFLRVVMSDRSEFDDLVEETGSAASFSKAATRLSLVRSEAAQGGSIGWRLPGRLPKALQSQLANAKPGDLLGPIQLDDDRWALYYLRQRRDWDPQTFEAVKPALARELRREAVAEQLETLRQRYGWSQSEPAGEVKP